MFRGTGPAFAVIVLAASAGSVLAHGPDPTAQPDSDDLSKAADAAAEAASVSPSNEDLSLAADAAAAVAGLSASAPAASKPSPDEVDLSALGLDPATATDQELTVYGFADLTYDSRHWSKDVGIEPQDSKTFLLGNLDLYLAKNLTAKARTLAEVRFSFLPNGGTGADGKTIDTTATDLTNYSRPVQWGGIVIERAYVEYDVSEHLTVRGGRWLTPYGIWNADHGSPVVISIGKPYIIGEQFFPEHQTGLDLFGSHAQSGFRLSYHATVSNGRGGAEAQQDQDNKFAFGGRLELETPWGLKAGGAYYRGRYTGLPVALGAPAETYLEVAYGGDLQFDRGPLHAQGEVILHKRHYEQDGRPDERDFGWYVLAGYRFDRLWNVMPFMFIEAERPADHSLFDGAIDANLGLNFRPTPSLVLKLMETYVWFPSGEGLFSDAVIREFEAQACWVF